ncbi:MAG: ATP-binding domain-containing protein, partial [Oscillospiraceae bacterium]|nr:ATP-binding domain-containing protein [Oscillospiraceae bacterium]
LEKSGYLSSLDADPVTADDRKENLRELVSNLMRYQEDAPDPTLTGFLEEVSLMTDIDQYNQEADAVVLMTMHAAKGLEFPYVFLPGWEEQVFPSYMALQSGAMSDLEEERRIAYVAITRAREQIYFSAAQIRLLYGNMMHNRPSRFLLEAGVAAEESKSKHNTGFSAGHPFSPAHFGSARESPQIDFPQSIAPPKTGASYSEGERIRHKAFGDGTIRKATQMGNDVMLEIVFDLHGSKKVMANFARLEKI